MSTEARERAGLLRIQDSSGRGPWRPGLSSKWVSSRADAPRLPAPIHEQVPKLSSIAASVHAAGRHIGCAVRGSVGLERWFLDDEIGRLKALGFHLVDCSHCRIEAETSDQVLFSSQWPLRRLPRALWPLRARIEQMKEITE